MRVAQLRRTLTVCLGTSLAGVLTLGSLAGCATTADPAANGTPSTSTAGAGTSTGGDMSGMPGMGGTPGTTNTTGATNGAVPTGAPILAADGLPVYAHTGAGDLQGAMTRARPLVYVPDQMGNTVQVIDPSTRAVINTFTVGRSPEHVVSNHDGSVLWVNSDTGNSMTPIDPVTGTPGQTIPVADPYNLYFTPDGAHALVMSERLRAVVVRDAGTMQEIRRVTVPDCAGINHGDFTADLQYFVASCEFNGRLVVFDAQVTHVVTTIDLNPIATPGATSPQMAKSMGGPKGGLSAGASAMPQDVRLTPDGRFILAADMLRNGLWVIDARTFTYVRFIPTGLGCHGIYPSRDASVLYVSNRDAGTVSVLDSATLTQRALWTIPGGGSPDMGGVSADGHQLWLSGRYNSQVYVFDTASGQLLDRIATRSGPHGLLVWPQPGRFSLGHTGNMR